MRQTIAPPSDPPRLTPNPEQIADPWREVVDLKKHKWMPRWKRMIPIGLDYIDVWQAGASGSGADAAFSATTLARLTIVAVAGLAHSCKVRRRPFVEVREHQPGPIRLKPKRSRLLCSSRVVRRTNRAYFRVFLISQAGRNYCSVSFRKACKESGDAYRDHRRDGRDGADFQQGSASVIPNERA
jgi:hypothetical protein